MTAGYGVKEECLLTRLFADGLFESPTDTFGTLR